MDDLAERIRDAVDASVVGAEPAFDMLAAVHRRHRRLVRRRAAVSAAVGATAVAVAVAAVLSAVGPAGPGNRQPAAGTTRHRSPGATAPLFPGGGRLLLANAGRLRWLYPDGRVVVLPGRFDGATVTAGELLAWRYSHYGPSYYTMALDGSGQRLVLPVGHDARISVISASLSADRTRLAYVVQDLVSQTAVTNTLWVLDLATGRRSDLGPIITSAFSWYDDSTILAGALDTRALVLVDAATGTRTSFLTVTDPALVSAYERARPGAGPPAYIGSDGVTGGGASARAAVLLAGGRPHRHSAPFDSPVEVVVSASGAPLVSYAPRTPEVLSLTWGPRGLLAIQTGAGDLPGSWKTYAGSLRNTTLSAPVPYGMDGVTFNPAGNVIALTDGGLVTFAATPRPECERTVRCLRFGLANLLQPGTIQAWVP